MNYSQNANAVHLSKGKTNIVGVILPYINHPCFDAMVSGMMETALAHNYRVLLCQTNYNKKEEMKSLHMLKQNNWMVLLFVHVQMIGKR